MLFDLLLGSPFISATLATVIYYTVHYFLNAAKKPKLFSAEGKLKRFIVQNVPIIKETYWPSFWCYHSHLLTPISNAFRQRNPKLQFHRYVVQKIN